MKLLHKGLLIICLVLLCGLLLPWNADAAGVTDSGTCGDDLTWTLDSEGTLTISGTGAMEDYDDYDAPWYDYWESIESVIIEEGVTTIGNEAFYCCGSLTDVTIGNSVTTIGDYSFSGCGSLTNITIPDSVTTIGDYAFGGCSSLNGIWVAYENPAYCSDARGVLFNKDMSTLIQAPGTIADSYTIPDSVATIGDTAFCGCESLINVTIGNGVSTIGYATFGDCRGLNEIIIPDSVTVIGDYAFSWCDSLTEVFIPDSVTTIGDAAFNNCNRLINVTIGNGVSTIGDYAFTDCDWLTTIVFRGDAPSIGYRAFRNIAATAYYPEGNDTWTEDVMQDYGGDITWVCGEPDDTGDLTGDSVVDNRDVAYLLWYTLFPEDYPITGDADFNGDGTVDNRDVAYLLWHTLFPEDYPL